MSWMDWMDWGFMLSLSFAVLWLAYTVDMEDF